MAAQVPDKYCVARRQIRNASGVACIRFGLPMIGVGGGGALKQWP